MPIQLTEAEIAALIAERKPLPSDFQARMKTKPKRGHRERDLDVVGSIRYVRFRTPMYPG